MRDQHTIRCGFWREAGAALAEQPVNKAIALLNARVYRKGDSWELAATEATQIIDCPDHLREELLGNNDHLWLVH